MGDLTQAKNRMYFNSTRNYTLSLLGSFDGIEYYVPEIENGEYKGDKVYTVPIKFGNYEKAVSLEDDKFSEKMLKQGNYNIIPRLVLSFGSMIKNTTRQTQKYQKFTKRVHLPGNEKITLDVSYNSVSYDFNYILLLQARGMTMASQITEEILTQFNPSYNLDLIEFPLFTEKTQTQILIQDPEFEIIEEFEDTQVNIINVTFPITVRGNLYQDIVPQGMIETVDLFFHLWNDINIKQSKLASYYKFDVSQETHKVYQETQRTYNGTKVYDHTVKLPLHLMEQTREDFSPPEIITQYINNYYNNYPEDGEISVYSHYSDNRDLNLDL
jgi:hypothetical protein